MKQEIKLPDFLPSSYVSWLELYRDVQKMFEEHGVTITDDSTVKIADLGTMEERAQFRAKFGHSRIFYNCFPVTLIKSRAFDEVLSKLPSFRKMYMLKDVVMSSPGCSQEIFQIFNDLLDILPWESD